MAFDESASYVVIRYAPKAWDRGQDPLTRKVNVPAGLSEAQAERWLWDKRLIKSGETIVSFHLSATKANDPMRFAGTSMLQVLPKSLVIAANVLVREAKTLNSATDTARGSTRDELADLMLTHARTLGLHADSREASASDRAQADALRDALMHEHARIVALPGPKPQRTTYYTDPSIDPRTDAAYTVRHAPKKRKELEMSEKANPYAGDIVAEAPPRDAELEAVWRDQANSAARAIGKLEDKLREAQRKGWDDVAASLQRGILTASQWQNECARRAVGGQAHEYGRGRDGVPRRKETEMDDERGTLWDALKRALKSNPTREKAKWDAPGSGPMRNDHGAGPILDEARNVLQSATGRLGKGWIRGSADRSFVRNVITDARHSLAALRPFLPAAWQAPQDDIQAEAQDLERGLTRALRQLENLGSAPGSKEASEKAVTMSPSEIQRMAAELGKAATKINSSSANIDDEEEEGIGDLLASAELFLNENERLEMAMRGLRNNYQALDRAYSQARSRGRIGKEAGESANGGEQWDEGGWGDAVEFDEDGNPKEADEDGDTLEGIMKAAKAMNQPGVVSQEFLWKIREGIRDITKTSTVNEVDRACMRATAVAMNERPGREIADAVADIRRQWDYEMEARQVGPVPTPNDTKVGGMITQLELATKRYLSSSGIKEASEKAGFPFQKKKKPAADPNAEGDPNAQQQPQQGQQPAQQQAAQQQAAQQQAPGKAPPFGKKKVPTPGQQPGMPQPEQDPQDGDAQDVEDPADIQTDAQGNQLGTNGEFAGQTVGSMTADQFGTALAAAMQPVIQAIAALNAATVQRTKEATDAAEARIANLEGEQPVMTRLERGYRASQKGPAPADAATYPMPNSAPSTEETFLDWALNGKNGARP